MINSRCALLILLCFVTFFANATVGQTENSVEFPHLKLAGQVNLPSNSLNRLMLFEPKKPVNVLPFLADTNALALCHLNEAEVAEIESALSRIEATLFELLSVTPKQKEKIVDQCLKGAKSLVIETNKLELKLVSLLKKQFPEVKRIQKLTENFQLDGRCASPDSILPLEYHNDFGVDGQLQSDQSLREHFFRGK